MKRARAAAVLTITTVVVSVLAVSQPAMAGKQSCYQPDAQVKSRGSGFLGDDIYNDGGGDQTRHRRLRAGHLDTFRLKFQNDTNDCSDSFFIDGDGSSGPFKVRYFSGGMDVTGAVVGGTFETESLSLGESERMTLTIKADDDANKGALKKVLVTATSEGDSGQSDTVGAEVLVTKTAGDQNGESA